MRLPNWIPVLGMITLLAGCGTEAPPFAQATAGVVPGCEDVPLLRAPDHLYRDAPIYVGNEMPVEEIRAWAAAKPGFEDLWIDRERLGWITVAFSEGAEARQAELRDRYPGVGAVVVAVPWTTAELQALQAEVHRRLPFVRGSGIQPQRGVVTVFVGVLEADRVAAVQAAFAGRRVCIEGVDPALVPADGPQPPSGDGWRLLFDRARVGTPYRTGIAFDAASYGALWAEIGIVDAQPEVDFETDVVVWFGAVYGSSCPRLRLDDVVVDRDRALVHAEIVNLDEPGVCTADANPRAYVVALERARLPAGPFSIQLGAEDPPPGAREERTIVDVDLSAPGSVAGPGEVHRDAPIFEQPPLESGDFMEPGFPQAYAMDVACGVEWLGELNSVAWRMAPAPGVADFVPEPWREAVVGERLELEILLREGAQPSILATANGHTVLYVPSPDRLPSCD